MVDPECAICCSLEKTKESLAEIVSYIEYSCVGQKSKQDFGLTKSFITRQIGVVKQMENWHKYYHSTGESLMDANRELNLESGNEPRRWFKPT